ncbi:ABC transporter substrate-binding protein, partial [Xanthomonas citri pv. citri]|nr:ABC transporter substrate-binding protein [Xanthomonas citri pv. citri]
SPDEVTGGLISGELDIAAVPVNLGAVLFNKTDGQILTAAVNTLGVLYVVENGNSVQSIADLAGRKILAAGQGSTPEYILNYILDK